MATARRVTIYRDSRRKWRYKVQAGNWRTVETAEQGFADRRSVLARVRSRWPGVEVVER